jgi:trimeric autotransporter adhesin
MKKIYSFTIIFSLMTCMAVFGQVSVNTDGSAPDSSAVLDVKSTTDGMLIPRMTHAQRIAIVRPATSLLVYQTDAEKGFYYNEGTKTDTNWIYIGSWWSLRGNAGIDPFGNPLDYFIGTTDGQDLVFKTNNTERLRIKSDFGSLYPNPDNTVDLGSADYSFRNLYLSGNIRFDDSVFIDNPATKGTFIGLTGNSTNTGYNNVFLGYHAGRANTSGYDNIFAGVEAGTANTTGFCNTASGFQSLYVNAGGWNNSAHGYGTLFSNTSGMDNSAIGVGALYWNTTGNKNSALGYGALYSNDSGDSNIAIGYMANAAAANNLSDVVVLGSGANATASDQVRLGNSHAASLYCMGAYTATTSLSPNMYVSNSGQIMRSTSGGGGGIGGAGNPTEVAFWTTPASIASDVNFYWDNVNKRLGIGTNIPADQLELTKNLRLTISTGVSGNIYKGDALFCHNFGDYNTFLGVHAGNLALASLSNTGVGVDALTSSTTGNANAAVGAWALQANADGYWNAALGMEALKTNISGNSNVAVGYIALKNSIASENTAIGASSLFNNLNGLQCTAVGKSSLLTNVSGNMNTAIGFGADVTQNNFANATALGANAKVNASNKVRIGNNLVTVIEGQVPWSFPSDIRIKKNIKGVSQGLDLVMKLRPVEYQTLTDSRTSLGFIAQEIEALFGDQYAIINIDNDDERSLSLRITDLIAPMVKAIQEQQTMLDKLTKDNEELEKRVAILEENRNE